MDATGPTPAALPTTDRVLDAAEFVGQLASWLPRQRWFPGTLEGGQQLRLTDRADLTDGVPRVVDLIVRRCDAAGRTLADLQVPLVLEPVETDNAADGAREEGAEIAVVTVDGTAVRVLDAARHPAGRAALLAVVTDTARIAQGTFLLEGDAAPTIEVDLRAAPVRSRILAGEQSNTSMILEFADQPAVIAKLFRVLQEGENPDVVVQGTLAAAGSAQVAPMIGAARVRWAAGDGDSDHEADGALHGHAIVIQQFFPGVEDAWRVALRDAVAGKDFSAGARELGEATAQVHAVLAAQMETTAPSGEERERIISSMLARLEEARAEVAEVDASADRFAQIIRSAASVAWPPLQRIHGDYHLGQVLAVPGRGWVLLDFEGEPMRPLAERVLPDCPIRDVAGMLRSLDYVAGAVRLEHDSDAGAWAASAREAFMDGYVRAAGIDPEDSAFRMLLAAFEADKAVYEALYETRNRPDWAPIPLEALARILG
ncbi:MAG: phosphotransferase [Brachybacterium sp.]|nr:phosphotransferase [Brachybacterium sp.]